MKCFALIFLLPFAFFINVAGQSRPEGKVYSAEDYVGNYYANIDPLSRFILKEEKGTLVMEILGQGHTSLTRIGKDRFSLNRVRPKAVIEFSRDSAGKAFKFRWIQTVPGFLFLRNPGTKSDSVTDPSNGTLSKYTGDYRLSVNRYKIVQVRIENNHLTSQGSNEGKFELTSIGGNRFIFSKGDLRMKYEFKSGPNGQFNEIEFSRTGSFDCIRTKEPFVSSEPVYGFNRPNGFTRGNTLRGKLTSLRTCYDVLFYDLDVLVDPKTRTVKGTNTIRFMAVTPFDRMQVDLFASMKIDKILFHNVSLSFTREFNAVFVQFPTEVKQGSQEEITIIYAGKPQTPDPASLAGGILWLQDKEGQYWIETVTQGSGASLWWPCKDHLSDKPDSMKISVTVPHGLTDISNGKLLRKTELPDNLTRFEWYVSYAITNYCVALNIGNYAHFSDVYVSGQDTLPLNYYSMKYDVSVARNIFKHTRPMLSVFEKHFGKYPFRRDGFTAMESIYPMEHQGAISIGSIFNPFNSNRYDSLDLIRTLWHESAHEWWGNSVTVKDMADLWVHEAFATYAEVLAYDELQGPKASAKYLKEQLPGNKDAIIGQYDVNDFRLGDMYSKGVLMLHTLRNIVHNDSLWFDLLRGIQRRFAYQTVTTQDIVKYISDQTKTDYSYFFEQYLTKASIPELQLKIKRQSSGITVSYRWKADVENFIMPVKVTLAGGNYDFIYPTADWKDLELEHIKIKDFKVDMGNFYIKVARITE